MAPLDLPQGDEPRPSRRILPRLLGARVVPILARQRRALRLLGEQRRARREPRLRDGGRSGIRRSDRHDGARDDHMEEGQ